MAIETTMRKPPNRVVLHGAVSGSATLQEPMRQMSEKHQMIDVVLEEFAVRKLKDAGLLKIYRVGREQHEDI